MSSLPIEVINIILEYQGYHIFRYGKYMKRISMNDQRRDMLTSMKKIRKNMYGVYEACIWKTIFTDTSVNLQKQMCVIIDTHTFPDFVLWTVNIAKYYDHQNSYDDRDRIQYILN